jgi:tetratricopeptide (TPR) repeat protein
MDVIRKYEEPDRRERELSRMTEYRYLREKLYPQLRSVRFDFHLHRAGMVKDTVHTTELDTVYMAGVQALKDLDYKKAVGLLRPYGDYNSALAFMSADYNHSALSVLDSLDDTDAKVCYLKAVVLSRLGQMEEAMKYFELALAYDPYLEHRANLDPEMHYLINKYKQL